MKAFFIFTLFIVACSSKPSTNGKIKNWDSLYNKAMFNNTYDKDDTVLKNPIHQKDTQFISYMYDYISGVRNISEIALNNISDSIREYKAFFANQKLYKIYVIGYRRADIGKRADYAKSLYYFDGDTLLSKDEYKLRLDLNTYREHFETLAKNFNDTLKLK